MPTFEYKARTPANEVRQGLIEASSQEAALDTLQQGGLMIVALKETGRPSFWEFNLSFSAGVKQKDVVILSRQLATLFEAHIPVVSTLKTLISEASKPNLKAAMANILDDVAGGLSLSQAMGKHQNIFSAFYINLVRSGEESGNVSAAGVVNGNTFGSG